MADLPSPITPEGCDLRGFEYLMLDVAGLRQSKAWLVARRKPIHGFYILNLLLAAWHQVPAASLPDDDELLAGLAECHHVDWLNARMDVLKGWVKCSDGRLYNPMLAERARTGWEAKQRLHRRFERVRELESGEWATLRAEVFARDNYTCSYCGAHGVALECDHRLPFSKGGLSVMENLTTACRTCNQAKGAQTEEEFRNGRA